MYCKSTTACKLYVILVLSYSTLILGCVSELGNNINTANATNTDHAADVIIDSTDHGTWFMVNGKPYFPISVWAQPYWELDYLKNLGVNTVYNNGLGNPEDSNRQLLDGLEQHDMHAFLGFHPTSHADFNYVKNHPRLLAWTIGDEPDLYGIAPNIVQNDYNAIIAADATHPVILNLTGGFYWDGVYGNGNNESAYQQYTQITEIVSFDHYPQTGWNQAAWAYQPGAMTDFMLNHYVNKQKLVGAIVEASDQDLSWLPSTTPGPTPAQMRFEVWDSIIHGAQMIGYFTIAFNPFSWNHLTPEIEMEMMRTNDQIQRLTPVILSNDHTTALPLTITETNGHPLNYTIRKNGEIYYLFVINAAMSDNPNTYPSSQATIAFASTPQSVTVFDENRAISTTGSGFTDHFDGLELHVYKIQF